MSLEDIPKSSSVRETSEPLVQAFKQEAKPQHTDQKFTKEELSKAWHRFFDDLPQLTPRLQTMRDRQLVLQDDYKIFVLISGDAEEQGIKPHRDSLLRFLKQTLKNNAIELVFKHMQQNATESKPYTQRDKFKELAKKHPILIEFQKRFGLDV